jgi:hypothetical protein
MQSHPQRVSLLLDLEETVETTNTIEIEYRYCTRYSAGCSYD